MEKEYIEYLLNAGYSIISESNGKLIRDVGDGVEVYDEAFHDFPTKVFKTFSRAFKYFEE